MKEAIGHTPLYSFIMVFIVVMFAFLSATLMYYKAYKVNNKIAYTLEEFEGINSLSKAEIGKILDGFGYLKNTDVECADSIVDKNGRTMKKVIDSVSIGYPICIYESPITSTVNNGPVKNGYFNYGIRTFIFFDIPVINTTIKLPVYSESERIYHFPDRKKGL